MKVKQKSMIMSNNFPDDNQNSDSPYHLTANRLMMLVRSAKFLGNGANLAYPYRTMQAAHTAARGISSLQKVSTKLRALISQGIRTASVVMLGESPLAFGR
jgi:hypothetical protein